MKKKILIISNSPLHRDPRVLVQYRALDKDYDIYLAGQTNIDGHSGIFIGLGANHFFGKVLRRVRQEVMRIQIRMRNFSAAYFAQYHVHLLLAAKFPADLDLIICNDIDMLGAAVEVKRVTGARIYLDCHEYTPRQWDGDPKFKPFEDYWDYLLVKYSEHVDVSTVVCGSIGALYNKNYSMKFSDTVMNLPEFIELEPLKPEGEKVKLVHHGSLNRNRKLEAMIELMKHLDKKFTLDFYFIDNDPDYLTELKDLGSNDSRIRFNEPVPTVNIATEINRYDIGLFPLSPESTNYRYALPNKFFEFIQARLAIAIWPSIEMKAIVEANDLGVVTNNFDILELAEMINSLTVQEIFQFKLNSHRVAREYSSERSQDVVRKNVRYLLS